MHRPETTLFRSSVVWTVIGLVGGLGYRELTRSHDFTGTTELAVVHTHALTLGALTFLIVLLLERTYAVSRHRAFRPFVWVWNPSLAVTVAAMTTIGTLEVLGSSAATSKALAGVAGLGHIGLTVGFVLLFVALGARIRAREEAPGTTLGAVEAGVAGVASSGSTSR